MGSGGWWVGDLWHAGDSESQGVGGYGDIIVVEPGGECLRGELVVRAQGVVGIGVMVV